MSRHSCKRLVSARRGERGQIEVLQRGAPYPMRTPAGPQAIRRRFAALQAKGVGVAVLEAVSHGDPSPIGQALAGASIRAMMRDRLGRNVWHRSLSEASAVLEELEKAARLWLLTRPAPLNPDQIDELRQPFAASW